MYVLFVIFLFILTLMFLKTYLNIKEGYDSINWNAEHLKHKGRCFDCEKEVINRYGEDAAWFAQQTKSFDSEPGFIAKTMRYY